MRLNALRAVTPRRAMIAGGAALTLLLAACGSDTPVAGSSTTTSSSTMTSSESSTTSSSDTSEAMTSDSSAPGTMTGDAATATSLADFGGMAGLEAAAKEEGQLNVIALPRDWANYGAIIDAFKAKYPEITVNEQAPNSTSAEEITAADTNAGTDAAPDVFDLGTAVTLANTAKYTPYQVAAWDDIPDGNKEATGLWVNDYAGTMAIGYNSTEYGDISSIQDLLDPKFAGVVALNGNPNEAGAAFNGVVMTSLANGGSLDDVKPGVDFWKSVAEAGNFFAGDVTSSTISSGEVGVVVDWSYLQVGYKNGLAADGVDWKVFIPEGAALGAFYNQAINVDAPNPAAARLWEEFLYSADAQNLWLVGGAQPILLDSMVTAGTVDQDALDALGATEAPVNQTEDQVNAAKAYLADNWVSVTG